MTVNDDFETSWTSATHPHVLYCFLGPSAATHGVFLDPSKPLVAGPMHVVFGYLKLQAAFLAYKYWQQAEAPVAAAASTELM